MIYFINQYSRHEAVMNFRLCKSSGGCRHFAFASVANQAGGMCYLKSGKGRVVVMGAPNDSAPDIQSGDVL